MANDKSCKSQVVYGENVKFDKSAEIYNLQNFKKNININDKARIKGEILIFAYGGNISIGKNFFLGEESRIWSGESIIIGNNVLISHQVNVIDSNSHEIDAEERNIGYLKIINEGHPTEKGSILTSPIVIGDNVWISFGATILKGVTIGEGAIIAAGSLVTKDVEPYTVVAGNPAKQVRKIEKTEHTK